MVLGQQQQQQLPHRPAAPVDVVEDHHDRTVSAHFGEQAADPLDQAVGAGRRVALMRDPAPAHQRQRIAGPASAHLARPLGLRTADAPAERLRPAAQRRQAPQGGAASGQPEGRLAFAGQQLRRQPCLAHPRLAQHQRHAQLSQLAALPLGSQLAQLPSASHQVASCTPARHMPDRR